MTSALSKNADARIWPLVPSSLTLNRAVEVLCVGGASLLVMIIFACLQDVRILMRDEVRLVMAQVVGASLLFAALLSYPHTMWSYRFAYGQGLSFIVKHAWELLGYPLLIVLLLALSALTWTVPVKSFAFVGAAESFVTSLGIAPHWTAYETLGKLLIASLLVLQIVMSGYHYGMQALGVAIACGERRGYKLNDAQKRYLRFNVYATWMVNLLSGYAFLSILDSQRFGYKPIIYPVLWQYTAGAAFVLSLVLVAIKVVLPAFKQNRSLPPLASGVSFLSLWLWLQPFFQPFGFQASVVPLAHGLQYLYFAGRGEAAGFDPKAAAALGEKRILRGLWLVALFTLLVGLGFLTYLYLPQQLDRATILKNLAPNFFILSAYIFLNTHHYMIDSVIWRGDSRLRNYWPTLTAA